MSTGQTDNFEDAEQPIGMGEAKHLLRLWWWLASYPQQRPI